MCNQILQFIKYCIFIMICNSWMLAIAISSLKIPVKNESNISIVVVDANSNNFVYNYNGDVPRLIASNMKLFTGLIALNQLGADYRWHTRLYYDGVINKHTLNGNLYLQGSGDPTLNSGNLYFIFAHLKELGINTINGNIFIDNSLLKTAASYSMLHSQNFDSDTVIPDNLIIDSNITHIYINKGYKNKFQLKTDLYGYKLINNLQIDHRAYTCSNIYNKLKFNIIRHNIIISGKLSKLCNNLDLKFNFLSNFKFNQAKLQQILYNLNFKFNGKFKQKAVLLKYNLVFDYSSDSLEAILITMNRFSDNLISEAVLLTSGINAYPKLDSYLASQKLFKNFISINELNNSALKFENGSGLSRKQYFTAKNIVHLLNIANKSLQQANFEATLAISGQEGTLKDEFSIFKNQIHAKTGSLDDTKALSGYFYAHSGKKYIFSIIINNVNMLDLKNIELFNGLILQVLSNLN